MKKKSVSERIAIFGPNRSEAICYFTLEKALEYRNLNLGRFVNRCTGLRLFSLDLRLRGQSAHITAKTVHAFATGDGKARAALGEKC